MVRAVIREVRDLHREVSTILEAHHGGFDPAAEPATACALLVSHLSMRRNKRCLLAYHRVRADKLKDGCWSGSDILEQSAHPPQQPSHPQQQQPRMTGDQFEAQGESGSTDTAFGAEGATASSLSPEEEDYVRQYSDLLAAYKGHWTDIDLTGSLEPPRELFIDVRVLKDAGEIQTEYGSINLTKNSQFYVRQGDVERLIAQGFLQKLN
ncbi:MAG: DNA replication protein psf1 [Caeruleum heppii]|nr:MAG: DNA replication protein psf1 [Caeruleum heppii]